jgi:hypothetical protein
MTPTLRPLRIGEILDVAISAEELWDGEKQTWHDKLANDVVVPVADYPVAR